MDGVKKTLKCDATDIRAKPGAAVGIASALALQKPALAALSAGSTPGAAAPGTPPVVLLVAFAVLLSEACARRRAADAGLAGAHSAAGPRLPSRQQASLHRPVSENQRPAHPVQASHAAADSAREGLRPRHHRTQAPQLSTAIAAPLACGGSKLPSSRALPRLASCPWRTGLENENQKRNQPLTAAPPVAAALPAC